MSSSVCIRSLVRITGVIVCCSLLPGETIPNMPGSWTRVFSEEGTGATLDGSRWYGLVPPIHGGDGHYRNGVPQADGAYYDVSQCRPNPTDGTIDLWIERKAQGGKAISSSYLNTWNRYAPLYGYVEARLRLPVNTPGVLSDFWMIAQDTSAVVWPPEIDIIESTGNAPERLDHYNIFGTYGTVIANRTASTRISSGRWSDAYHIIGLRWQPELLVFSVDRQEVFRTTHNVPGRAMYLLLTNEVWGYGQQWFGDPTQAALPARMQVDYVRGYQIDGAWPTDSATIAMQGFESPALPGTIYGDCAVELTSESRSGARCIRLGGTTDSNGFAQRLNGLAANTTYVVTGQARGDAGSQAWIVCNGTSRQVVTGTAWSRFIFTITSTAAGSLDLHGWRGRQAGQVRIDDLRVDRDLIPDPECTGNLVDTWGAYGDVTVVGRQIAGGTGNGMRIGGGNDGQGFALRLAGLTPGAAYRFTVDLRGESATDGVWIGPDSAVQLATPGTGWTARTITVTASSDGGALVSAWRGRGNGAVLVRAPRLTRD